MCNRMFRNSGGSRVRAREFGVEQHRPNFPITSLNAARKGAMNKLPHASSKQPAQGKLSLKPIVSLKEPPPDFPWSESLRELYERYGDQPAELVRNRAGRTYSLRRYQRAFTYFPEVAADDRPEKTPFFYFAGICAQLALSSHLLNVGFSDDWCRRFIGVRVAKSLAYANATGFRCECEGLARLARVLSPYSKWNEEPLFGQKGPDCDGLSEDEARHLLRNLLTHVRHRTGHRLKGTPLMARVMGGGSDG